MMNYARTCGHGLTLTSPQAAEEGLQAVFGTIAVGPSVNRREARSALAEGGADMGNHRCIFGMAVGMLFQLDQKVFDLPLMRLGVGRGCPSCLEGQVVAPLDSQARWRWSCRY